MCGGQHLVASLKGQVEHKHGSSGGKGLDTYVLLHCKV